MGDDGTRTGRAGRATLREPGRLRPPRGPGRGSRRAVLDRARQPAPAPDRRAAAGAGGAAGVAEGGLPGPGRLHPPAGVEHPGRQGAPTRGGPGHRPGPARRGRLRPRAGGQALCVGGERPGRVRLLGADAGRVGERGDPDLGGHHQPGPRRHPGLRAGPARPRRSAVHPRRPGHPGRPAPCGHVRRGWGRGRRLRHRQGRDRGTTHRVAAGDRRDPPHHRPPGPTGPATPPPAAGSARP